jgi:hypothetical protein
MAGGNKKASLQTRWCCWFLLELGLWQSSQETPYIDPNFVGPPSLGAFVLGLPEPSVSPDPISEIFGVTHSNFS